MKTMQVLSHGILVKQVADVVGRYRKNNVKEISLSNFRTALKSHLSGYDCWFPTDEEMVKALKEINTITMLGLSNPTTTIVFHEELRGANNATKEKLPSEVKTG